MRFAGQTLEVECGALFHFGVVRSESPCADRFVCPKLCEETGNVIDPLVVSRAQVPGPTAALNVVGSQ